MDDRSPYQVVESAWSWVCWDLDANNRVLANPGFAQDFSSISLIWERGFAASKAGAGFNKDALEEMWAAVVAANELQLSYAREQLISLTYEASRSRITKGVDEALTFLKRMGNPTPDTKPIVLLNEATKYIAALQVNIASAKEARNRRDRAVRNAGLQATARSPRSAASIHW